MAATAAATSACQQTATCRATDVAPYHLAPIGTELLHTTCRAELLHTACRAATYPNHITPTLQCRLALRDGLRACRRSTQHAHFRRLPRKTPTKPPDSSSSALLAPVIDIAPNYAVAATRRWRA